MQYPIRAFALALLVSCGGTDSDFTRDESLSIFQSANSELHSLHLAGLELEEWPSTYEWDCPGGGQIAMVTSYDGEEQLENIDALLHTFQACVLDGRTLSGTIDYLNFSFVSCGSGDGVAFDIDADLEIVGEDEGSCAMDAREDCGNASGTTCGHEI